jgi:DNA-binding response OmpR family regulator
MGSLAGRRVLVVEDEILLAMELEDVLAEAGCKDIATAGTVQAALEQVRRWRPDGVVLDLNLHGEKSFPVADALDEAGIPFIIVSGHSRAIVPRRHIERPFIEKPSDPRHVVRTLWAVIAGRER